MDDYINREDFIKKITKRPELKFNIPKRPELKFNIPVYISITDVLTVIDEMPSVDAVEVVRCKDCKYRMKLSFKILKQICEHNDFKIKFYDDCCEIQGTSPMGGDIVVDLPYQKQDTEDIKCLHIIDNLYEHIRSFDVSEETYLWLDQFGHGKNGAPHDIKDLYENTEAQLDMLTDLYNDFELIKELKINE